MTHFATQPLGPQRVSIGRVSAPRSSLLVCLLATSAMAGDFHTQVFDAKVRSVQVVKAHAFDDRLDSLDAKPVVLRGGPACEVSLEVAEPFFKGPQVVFARVQACEVLKTKPSVRVQYLGLAMAFQFVALQLDGVWRALPLMKRTESKNANVLACLNGDAGSHCAPESGPAL
jgi:hypothetical protein